MPLIERIVAFCCRNAAAVVAGSLLLAVAAGWYTADNFAMNSNSATLISPDTDWRKREIRFDALFPQHTNLILVVIDGKTPELAEAAAAASKIIRDAAKALPGADGVRVRLTGDVPLADEEFGTLADRAELMLGAMLAGVLLTLWLALRSFKIIFAILVTLFVGLAWTMAIGLWSVGVFNIISIAFIALFVGLGVDFGIQFSVRYRC